MKVFQLGCAILFLLCSALPSLGQESTVLSSAPEPKLIAPLEVYPERFQAHWKELSSAVMVDRFDLAQQSIDRIQALKEQAGFTALEGYSLELLEVARLRLERGDSGSALFFFNTALIFSPDSPRVLIKALPISAALKGSLAAAKVLLHAAVNIFAYPEALLLAAKQLIYPLLWPLMLAQCLICAAYFCIFMPDVLRGSMQFLPGLFRGILAPLVAAAFLCTPLFLGPFWCVLIWGLALYLLLPRARRLLFSAAAVLLLWHGGILLHEKLELWLADKEVLSMLRVHAGSYSPLEHRSLGRLVERRPNDGAAAFMYGQALRRRGDFSGAAAELERAGELLGQEGAVLAAQGVVKYFQADFKAADKLFAAAEAQGFATPEFYLFYSKIKVALTDLPGGQEYFVKARNADKQAVQRQMRFEEREDIDPAQSILEMRLPAAVLLESVAASEADAEDGYLLTTTSLIGYPVPDLLLGGGVALFLFFLLGRKNSRIDRFRSYFPHYAAPAPLRALIWLLPGGGFIYSGRLLTSVVVLAVILAGVLPLLGWPPQGAQAVDALGAAQTAFGGFMGFLYICVIGAARLMQRED